jgi:DNA-binding NarL/FixJ family response regulator
VGINREVATEHLVNPTTDYHLRNLYQKPGVSCRTQMARKITAGTG